MPIFGLRIPIPNKIGNFLEIKIFLFNSEKFAKISKFQKISTFSEKCFKKFLFSKKSAILRKKYKNFSEKSKIFRVLNRSAIFFVEMFKIFLFKSVSEKIAISEFQKMSTFSEKCLKIFYFRLYGNVQKISEYQKIGNFCKIFQNLK